MSTISVLNTDAGTTGKTVVTAEGSDTITGAKTFDRDPSAPFAVSSGSAVVANLDADKVDGQDYTTGTFTPTIVSAGGGTPTYSVQVGIYRRFGSFNWITGRVTLATFGSLAAGAVTIQGIPTSSVSTTNTHTGIYIPFYAALTTNVYQVTGYIVPGTATITLNIVTAAATTVTIATKADLSATSDIIFTGLYAI